MRFFDMISQFHVGNHVSVVLNEVFSALKADVHSLSVFISFLLEVVSCFNHAV